MAVKTASKLSKCICVSVFQWLKVRVKRTARPQWA